MVTREAGPLAEPTRKRCPGCGRLDPSVSWQISAMRRGVQYWACERCGWAWPRLGGTPEQHTASVRYVKWHNAVLRNADRESDDTE